MYWLVELWGQGKALTCTSSQEHYCYLFYFDFLLQIPFEKQILLLN